MKRKVPRLTTDEEAEALLDQDLSDLDFAQFKLVRFEREPGGVHERVSDGHEPDNEKKIPVFRTDEEAERFVEEADLTEYDLSQFKPVRFEFEKKAARVNMRLSEALLNAVKARAQARGIPYQRFIREALEQAIAHD